MVVAQGAAVDLTATLTHMPVFAAAYFLVELFAFMALGWAVGFGWALLILAILFIAGVALAGWQMRALSRRVKTDTSHPGRLTGDAALTAVGAFLVALPGIVSTVCGILLILPPTRRLVSQSLGQAAKRKIAKLGGTTFTTASFYGDPATRDIPGWGEVIDHRSDEFGDHRGPGPR